jgi:2-octaprenyl-6-methoxyphenol hydroxylase
MTLLAELDSRGSVAETAETLVCDLAIVGGGIVGMTLAVALKDSGLKIAIIESQSLDKAALKPQAYALSILSSRIFEGIGVWKQIFPKIGNFRYIRLSDGNFPHVVTFQAAELGCDYLGYVAEHRAIASVLQADLARCDRVQWLCPATVQHVDYQKQAALLTLNQNNQTYRLQANLVVGADGSRSQIRQQAAIKTKGWKYWQSCVAFTIEHDAPRNDIAFECFWHTGPMGILPLPNNRAQIVWTHPHAEAQALQTMPEEAFLQQLADRTQGLFENISLVSDRALFPVQLMQSDRYVQPRLALIGDAAHCCHPVGGQGLNLGIRDAAALAQVLTTNLAQNRDIGDLNGLKEYQSWRRRENWTTLGFTDFLDRLFSNNLLPLVGVRQLGLWVMKNLTPVKIWALKLMTGLLGKTPDLAQQKT